MELQKLKITTNNTLITRLIVFISSTHTKIKSFFKNVNLIHLEDITDICYEQYSTVFPICKMTGFRNSTIQIYKT